MYFVGGEDLLIVYYMIEVVWDDRRFVLIFIRNGSCILLNYKVWYVMINVLLLLFLDSNKVFFI